VNRSDPLVSFARLVGDFGNPFYDEERQRDVWNEASAFGFQLVLWCSLLASTVLVWAVGAPALPYAMGLVVLVGSASLLTLGYAQRLGISLTGTRMMRARMLPLLVLMLALAGGLVRASISGDGFSSGFGIGMAVGGLGALLALGLATRRRTQS